MLHYIVRTIAAKERSADAELEAPAVAPVAADPSSSSSPASSGYPPDGAAPRKKPRSRSPTGKKAWQGGAPPGCRGNGSGGTRPSPSSGRRGAAGRAVTSTLRGGGSRRGAAAVLVRVEGLDLQDELRTVREAAKIPVGEILMDLRQARKGLRQVKGELQRVLADEAKKGESGGGAAGAGAGAVVGGEKRNGATDTAAAASAASAAAAAPKRLSVVSEGSERSMSTSTSSSSSSSLALPAEPSCSAEGEGGDPPGVRKLSAFAEKAEVRLSSIEREASACVGLCKDLGEYFGEGADEVQSHHIFRTLVQFLDLLQEAKKVEGLR